MAIGIIQKRTSTKKAQFFFNESFLGTSEYQHGFFMKEISVFQNSKLEYRLKESNRFIWFLRNCLYLISFIFQIFLCPKYTIFDNKGKVIGNSHENCFRPARTFTIYNNLYHILIHKNSYFSLFKNGIQIALYERKKNEYFIYYSDDESVETIGLFCLFIDLNFFTNYNGRITKVIVLHDSHPEYTTWRPKE